MTAPVKPLTLTRLDNRMKIVGEDGTALPSFIQTINNAFANILVSFAALSGNQTSLEALVQAIVDLNGLVTNVQTTVETAASAAALLSSYTDPISVLTGTVASGTATIVIANHSRIYSDGTTKAVIGGTFTIPAVADTLYVYYRDVPHHGGAVAYLHSINPSDAAQVAGVHCVGSITLGTTNTTAPQGGSYSPPPGVPGRFYDRTPNLD